MHDEHGLREDPYGPREGSADLPAEEPFDLPENADEARALLTLVLGERVATPKEAVDALADALLRCDQDRALRYSAIVDDVRET